MLLCGFALDASSLRVRNVKLFLNDFGHIGPGVIFELPQDSLYPFQGRHLRIVYVFGRPQTANGVDNISFGFQKQRN